MKRKPRKVNLNLSVDAELAKIVRADSIRFNKSVNAIGERALRCLCSFKIAERAQHYTTLPDKRSGSKPKVKVCKMNAPQ